MMGHKFYFVSGLPRSGSTLLVNILGQNPRFHVTSTSGVADLISGVRAQWNTTTEFKATPNDAALMRVMAGVLPSFYADVSRPVVLEKSRGWLAMLEWLVAAYGPVKVLVPVRDIRGILSSLEKIHRRNVLRWRYEPDQRYLQMQTVEGRCARWLDYDSPLGIAHGRVRDAIQRGFGSMLYFVDYAELMERPAETLAGIYRFLGEPFFAHAFNAVEQLTVEDDAVYGMGDLHTIRNAVEPAREDWREVLGDFAEQYGAWSFGHGAHEN